jgi:hypothetical protein
VPNAVDAKLEISIETIERRYEPYRYEHRAQPTAARQMR